MIQLRKYLTKKGLFVLIALTAHSFVVCGQLKASTHYYYKAGMFCGENIMLDSTGLFFQEWGCENDVRVRMGKYFITKAGRVRLNYRSLDKLSPVKYIKKTMPAADSIVEIRLVDREGTPVSFGSDVTLVDTAGNYERRWWFDSVGLILVNRFKYVDLLLDQLALIYDEVVSFKIDDHSREIQFNLPGSFLWGSQTKRGKGNRLKLFLKGDGFYDRKSKKFFSKVN